MYEHRGGIVAVDAVVEQKLGWRFFISHCYLTGLIIILWPLTVQNMISYCPHNRKIVNWDHSYSLVHCGSLALTFSAIVSLSTTIEWNILLHGTLHSIRGHAKFSMPFWQPYFWPMDVDYQELFWFVNDTPHTCSLR